MTAARHIRRLVVAAVAATAMLWVPACSSTGAHIPSAHKTAQARPTTNISTGTGSATCDPTASLRPTGPPVVTHGSFMADIKTRGQLIVGVSASSYHFGYFNPLDGRIEGFDIDMLHAIAAAIFGNPNSIRYVVVPDTLRIEALQSDEVDIVAETMTATCVRWRQVDFSSVYLDPAQSVLVPRNSRATTLSDLVGKRICAGKPGITSWDYLKAHMGHTDPPTTLVPAQTWADCLVLLQEDKVDAISTDETILAGLTAQDPETKIMRVSLAPQPYGLAISQQHPDFVRFVNAVLAKMRADGQWAAIYKHWIGTPVPPPPPAHYRD